MLFVSRRLHSLTFSCFILYRALLIIGPLLPRTVEYWGGNKDRIQTLTWLITMKCFHLQNSIMILTKAVPKLFHLLEAHSCRHNSARVHIQPQKLFFYMHLPAEVSWSPTQLCLRDGISILNITISLTIGHKDEAKNIPQGMILLLV